MKQLPYSSVILTIVLSALICVSGTMLYQAYHGSQQALQEEIRLTHSYDEKLLQRVIDTYLHQINQITKDLASRTEIQTSLQNRDVATTATLLTESIYSSPKIQMDALAIRTSNGNHLLIHNSSLQSLEIDLQEQIPLYGSAMNGQDLLRINQSDQTFHFVRFQAPIVSSELGEVIGVVYAFILLNDNYLMLSQALDITGAEAISLHQDKQLISAVGDIQEIINSTQTSASDDVIIATDKGTLQAHGISVASQPFKITLHKANTSLETLSQAYNKSLREGIILVVIIAIATMLLIRFLTNRSLTRLINYAERAPAAQSTPVFENDRFIEFDQLGTQIESMLRDIREQESQLDAIFHNTPSAMFLKSTSFEYLMVNGRFNDLFLGPGHSAIGQDDFNILPPQEAELIRDSDQQVLDSRQTLQSEYMLTTTLGPRTFLSTKFPMINDRNELYAIGGITTDITDKVIAKREAEVTQHVFESAAEAILIYNPNGEVITNPSFDRITGLNNAKARSFALAILKDHPEIDSTLAETGRWQGESIRRKPDGEMLPIWLSISALKSPHSEQSYVAVFSDITKLKEAEQQLERLAHYDSLTNLPNRILFYDRLTSALARSQRNNQKTSLLFIDIDRFKQINDSYGHHIGDKLLVESAKRIETHIRPEDTVCRLGGDEFTVILNDLEGTNPVQDIARRIYKSLREPFQFENSEIFTSASIGIAMYPDDAETAEILLKHADTAMYHAKENVKNDIAFFDKELNQQAEARALLEGSLKVALNTDQLFLVFQPRFHISASKILSAEALLRWKHPTHGFISPSEFIPLAESSGLIVELGRWVLMQACTAAQKWNAYSEHSVPVSVNLSARQLHDPDILVDIENALNQTGLDPSLLELEITETMVIWDMDTVISRLEAIRSIGVNLSVDDFGTGYSSLIYLKRLPVSTVKIDKSFIDDVPGTNDSENLVKAIISMSHSLGLQVVAEGVETDQQLTFLTDHHCDEIQGYLLAKPDTAKQLESLLSNEQQTAI